MSRVSLSDYKVMVKIPVQWGDMDAAKHVSNIVYMQWAESARMEYFRRIGIDISFSGHQAGPIIGWQDCKYIFPLTFPDTAFVGMRTIEIHTDRLKTETSIFSAHHERIAAIGRQEIIPYDYSALEKTSLPQAWIEEIKKLDGI